MLNILLFTYPNLFGDQLCVIFTCDKELILYIVDRFYGLSPKVV